jgi:hypothetical protein
MIRARGPVKVASGGQGIPTPGVADVNDGSQHHQALNLLGRQTPLVA